MSEERREQNRRRGNNAKKEAPAEQEAGAGNEGEGVSSAKDKPKRYSDRRKEEKLRREQAKNAEDSPRSEMGSISEKVEGLSISEEMVGLNRSMPSKYLIFVFLA